MVSVIVNRVSQTGRARVLLVPMFVLWVLASSGAVQSEEAAGDPASSSMSSGVQTGPKTIVLPPGQATTTSTTGTGTPADAGAAMGSTNILGSPSLQDATGKKIVFPITDSNGRVLFQNASDLPMSTSTTSSKPDNYTMPSSKLPGDPPKKGAKPNAASLLHVDTLSAAAWLSAATVAFSLFA